MSLSKNDGMFNVIHNSFPNKFLSFSGWDLDLLKRSIGNRLK